MSRFSFFVPKTSSHQEEWFDGAHLAEQAGTAQDKVRGALEVAKQMTDWQPNNPVLRCRIDHGVASIHGVHRRYATADPRSKTCFRCTAAVVPSAWRKKLGSS